MRPKRNEMKTLRGECKLQAKKYLADTKSRGGNVGKRCRRRTKWK